MTQNPPTVPGEETGQKRKRENEVEVVEEQNNLETQSPTGPDPTKPSPCPTQQHPLHKTSLCSFFRRQGSAESCSHGESCRFAHTEDELRPRPDGSWDPTSQRARKMARRESGDEGCGNDDDGDGDGDDNENDDGETVMMTEIMVEFGEDPQLSKCLVHLPRKWDSQQLKSFLDEQEVKFKFAKKKKGMSVGFVTFEAAEEVKSAAQVLEGKPLGTKKLKVRDVIPRSCDDKIKSAQKRYETVQSGAVDETEASMVANENGDAGNGSGSKVKSARDVVTPLAHLPYAEQLEKKKNSLLQILKRLTRNARKACPKGITLPEWVVKSREIGGLPCVLEGIIESPSVDGYRNKCEFSVGYSVQRKVTVGFMLGNFREGVTAVEEPINCPNVSKIACKYALLFQEFLQNSALPIWNRFNNTGFWRQLTVREGRNPQKDDEIRSQTINISEVLLMVQVSTEGFDDDLINQELGKLTQTFVSGAASVSLPLTALVLQDHKGFSNAAPADAPSRPLPIIITEASSGSEVVKTISETRIHDYIGSLKFSISPTAFFQVNTLAAEKLYSLAGQWAGLGPDTLLFDVCCGTGTIGLTLANRVGMVIGIEMNASAVSDAQRNAEINGIGNCKFICAKAEDVMGSLLREYFDVSQQQDDTMHHVEKQNVSVNGELKVVDNKPDSQMPLSEEGPKIDKAVDSDNREDQISKVQNHEADIHGVTKQRFKNIVAIVDPPRSGLHPIVTKALRTHPCLKRLVYISCNPETLVANAIELCTPSPDKCEKGGCRSQGWRGMSNAGVARQRVKSMPKSEPFQPVKAMAVDLFPHTPHCELVMLLER